MRNGKKLTFLATLVCILALLFSVISYTLPAAIAGSADTNKVTATASATIKQGNTGTCYVYIDSLESLSSLNVAVHYDPDKISVTSSFNKVSCSLYDSSVSDSYVQFSYLFDGNGKAEKTQLFYFKYNVLSDAETGGSYFDIIVNEAYDSTLNVADVSGSRCNFAIEKAEATKTCTISGSSSLSTSIKDEFELSYRLNTVNVASGSFVIRYDEEIFELIDLSVGGLLENKFYDIKTDQPGSIYVSFVGTEYSESSQLLNIKFRTLKNITKTSKITLSVTDFYDMSLNSISCSGYTTSVKVNYDLFYSEESPTVTAIPHYSAEKNQLTVAIALEKDSHLGAGDFVLKFNTDYFTYKSAEKNSKPDHFNINDKKVSEGILKFSIISLSDIVTEETLLTVTFDTPVFCNDVFAEFEIDGSGLADSMTKTILLNFADSSIGISGVGHDEIIHSAQAPTCTEIGWFEYTTCSRCDYTTYVEIPANGHSYLHTFCTVCNEKQPVNKSWDISENEDGTLTANLYKNSFDGAYELEITGTGPMKNWSSYSSVPWYSTYRNTINYLVIEDGVTSVGSRAFSRLSSLTYTSVPDSVESIGDYAFYECTLLSSVSFGSSVKSIGTYAFGSCSALGNAVLPDCVETIGSNAFSYCTALENVSLGDSVTTIGASAFYNCTSLATINIPETVTSIGSSAFYNCTALTEIFFNAAAINDMENNNNVFYNAGVSADGIKVHFGKNVARVPAYLFYSTSNGTKYLPKITEVSFEEDSVCESIGKYAFYYSDDLIGIELPDSVNTIESRAFAYCSNMASAKLGNSVTSIGDYAFYDCSALESADLGDSVTTIGTYAFCGCTSLKSITIPESLTSIGSNAFSGCTALTEIFFNAAAMGDMTSNNHVFYNAGVNADGIKVHFGKNVTRIPAYLFYPYSYNTSDLPKITEVSFEEDSVCESIGTYAFYCSDELTTLTIPETVTSIENSAFFGCKALTEITFNATAMSDMSSNNYVFYNAGVNAEGIKVHFGKNVSRVPAYLFCPYSNASNFPKITEVTFEEDSVCESIGTYAFYYSDELTTLIIPETVTSIGNYAFCNCTALTEIYFDATAMSDLVSGNGVFYNAGVNTDGIKVHIGKNVTRIPAYLFCPTASYPPKITEVIFEEDSICESIGTYAFSYSEDLIDIELPDSVVTIEKYAFAYCSNMTSVKLSNSVTTIGAYAFCDCSSLESITIPESVTSIGNSAFYNCKALTEINFNANVNDLANGNGVFYNAGVNADGIKVHFGKNVTRVPAYLFCPSTSYLPKITEVTFEEGSVCESIGTYAFYYADELTGIELPDSVVTIGTYAFAYCSNMTSAKLGNSVSVIDYFAFYCCSALESAEVGDSVTYIGSYAFYGCSSLKSITIPETVTNIENYAFSGCTALTEITFNANIYDLDENNYVFYNAGVNADGIKVHFGKNVTRVPAYLFCPYSNDSSSMPKITEITFEEGSVCESIGAYAFYYSDDITSLTIPENIKSIETYAFYNLISLTEIYFNAADMNDMESGHNVFFNAGVNADGVKVHFGKNVTRVPAYLFYPTSNGTSNLPKITEVSFEEDSVCESIGTYAFYYSDDLMGIELPDSVATIENRAFAYCSNMASAKLGNSVTSIGAYAFYYCSALESADIGDSVTTIGAYTFCGCSSLKSITIPESVTSIGNGAFSGCTALTEIIFNAASVSDMTSNNYVFSNAGISADGLKVHFGKNVTRVPAYLFYPYSSSTSSLPKITEVSFEEDSVCESIGTYAFYYSDDLTAIELPDSVVIIENRAFANCSNMASAKLGNSLTSIGDYAFNGCSSLENADLGISVTTIGTYAFYNCSALEMLVVGDSVTSIGNYAFYNCSALKNIDLSSCVTIGNYAFYGCSSLETAVLGDSVTNIETYAFNGCSSLKSITIPESLTSIGSNAFSGCTALTEIIFNAASVSDMTSNNYVFYNAGISADGLKVHFGKNVTRVPAYLFYPYSSTTSALPKITEVSFEEGSVCESIGAYAFYYSDDLISLELPDSVATIENHAFANCSNMASAKLGNSLTTIGTYAFYNCSALKNINLGSCVNIGDYAFYNCSALESAGLGNSVTNIGTYAFYGCSSLKSITIPESLTSIGSNAFSGCTALTEIFFNAAAMNDMASDNYVFYNAGVNADGIKVHFGKNVTRIPAYLFYPYSYNTSNLPKITEVSFEEDSICESIGAYAFYGSDEFTVLNLPESLKVIDTCAFRNCSELLRVTLPESLSTIGDNAFYGCEKAIFGFSGSEAPESDWRSSNATVYLNVDSFSVTDNALYVVFKDETATLAKYYGSDSEYQILSNIENAPVTTIAKYAFRSKTSLESITIPDSIVTIEPYAFYECTALTEIFFNAAAMNDMASNNYVFYNAGVNADGISVHFGKNVTRVPAYLFRPYSNNAANLPKITEVTFEEGSVCESIGAYAFYYSDDLTDIELPDSLKSVEAYAFYYCINLLRASVPDSLTSIGTYAFYGCEKAVIGFKADALPESLGSTWKSSNATTYLGFESFYITDDALYVVFKNGTAALAKYYGSASEYQVLENIGSVPVSSVGNGAFRANTTLEKVFLPDSITAIEAYAFYNCSALKSITIPESITSIGKYAFYNCTKVEEIFFNAVSMQNLAYDNCVFYNNGKDTDGISVTIGEKVKSIPDYLFRSAHNDVYNAKITSIVFAENSVCEKIGTCSFYGLDYLAAIIIPETVNEIKDHAISYCQKLTIGFEAAELPATLGSYWGSDSGYYLNVKEFVLYDDATYVISNDNEVALGRYVGDGTYYEIKDKIDGIPVTKIGSYAFYNNKSIVNVSIPDSVAYIGDYAFYYCSALESITLPEGLASIGNYAFSYCTKLLTLMVPEAVSSIGSGAFAGSTNLTVGFISATLPENLVSGWQTDIRYSTDADRFVLYDDATYLVTKNNTAMLGRYYGADTEYTIHDKIGSAPVTVIGNYAFRNATSLTDVHIPESVTRIEDSAFYYCSALESITIPQNVSYIGSYAFYYTTALTEINFNAVSVSDMSSYNYIFYCSGKNTDGIKVTIGSQVSKIPSYLFYPYSSSSYIPKITEVVFEENSHCESIGSSAFYLSAELSDIVLPESIKTIGKFAFYGCSALTQINIPENVTNIESCAFQNSGLKLVYIHSGKIAGNLTSETSSGYLLKNATETLIRSDINVVGSYISQKYTKTEAITYCGTDYTVYSNHDHSWAEYEELAAHIPCQQDGCIRYSCSECSVYKDVTTFRHNVSLNEAREPDCINIGWKEFYTCSDCDYSTYEEIAPLGHRTIVENKIFTDSIETVNDPTYPFLLDNGIYSSTNISDNTSSYFTITALYDCVLNLSYAVSSEQNYDKVIIRHNNTITAEISGLVDWIDTTIELKAGDTVTVNYYKDESRAINEDTGWFSFSCKQTEIIDNVEMPSEEVEPTCTESVICSFCDTLIKDSLGHDEISHEAQTVSCTEIGWNEYVTCSRCDYTTYVEISALGHDEISHEAQTVSCTEIGWNEYVTCSRCDYTTYEEIAALGHNEISHEAQTVSCTEIGWDEYVTCSRCDYTTYVEIPALGHDEISHEALDPTCTEVGWNEYVTCSRCDYTTYTEIPATGHNYVDKICTNCVKDQPSSYSWDISADEDGSVMANCYAIENGNYLMEIVGSGRMKDCTGSTPWYSISNRITKLTIKDGVTYIGSRAFSNISTLVTVEIPESVQGIGNRAFNDCSRLTVILRHTSVPEDLDSEWTYHVPYYLNPKDVYIENGITYVVGQDDALYLARYNSNEATAEISSDVTHIGDYAFYGKNTELLYIPESVVSIGKYAFASEKRLIAIFLGESLPSSLGSNWNNSSTYYVNPKDVIVNEDSIYIIDQNDDVYLARYKGSADNYEIPEHIKGLAVTHIGDYAFYNCGQLINLTVPSAVESIGDHAFYFCTNLRDFEMPASLKKIGEWAFWFCKSLKNVILPEGLHTMGGVTFGHCDKLQSVYIPGSLKVIPNQIFTNCINLENVEIAEGVTQIRFYAFYNCKKLRQIIIPASVKSIESTLTFNGCENLGLVVIKSTDIANQVTSSTSMGSLCEKAITVVVPENATASSYLTETYPISEQALIDNGNYIIYSMNEHSWTDSTAVEMIPCEIDGLIYHTCSDCGVRKETIIPCHDKLTHSALSPTCTEVGWDEYEACSRCDYTTYVEIPATGHTLSDWAETLAPDCTDKGTEARKCENCDYTETRDKDALGHDEIHHDAHSPSCTEIGWKEYVTCSRCDYTTYEETAATGHTLSDWAETLAPTCTDKGSEKRTCENCDYTETRDKDALGHDEIHHDALSPSCTEIGWKEYVTCSRCDYTTYEETAATGHTLSDWAETITPTCTDKGTETRKCDNCDYTETRDKDALGHDEIHHDALSPSCTEIGWKEYVTCSRCDYTTYEETAATGHTLSDWAETLAPTCTDKGTETRKCDNCDYSESRDKDALGHDEIHHDALSPSCTEIGWKEYVTCSRCDYTTYEETAATGHTLSDWAETIAPTCTDKGTEARKCDNCDYTETRDKDALGHDEIHHDALSPSCTEIGWKEYVTCSRCDYTTYEETAATGHTLSDWAETLAPTCTDKGTETRKCENCDYSESRDKDALGHDVIFHNEQAPSCTEIGWKEYVTCSRCDYTTYEETAATGHTPSDWITDTEATYESDGLKHKECTVCQEILEISIIPMLTHSYVSVITEPTCTEQGYTTHTCSDCGDSYTDDYVPATGHSYGEWTTDVAPGCETEGSEKHICSVCNHSETKTLSPTGHTESEWIKVSEPTCTENGSENKICTVCYKVLEVNPISALGHKETGHSAKAPTCTEKGWHTYVTCSECDYSTYTEIEATGHAYVPDVILPTCTDKGYTVHTCQCGDSYTDSEKAALGHKMALYRTVNATCTEDGFNEYKCSTCEYSSYESIPATGHTEVIAPSVNATCTASGLNEGKHCSVCKEVLTEQTVIAALGHSMGKWIVTKSETCTTNGSRYSVCSRCDYSVTETIKAKGHSYTTTVTSPTCTEQGYTTYSCSCGDKYLSNYVSEKGHRDNNNDGNCDSCGTKLRDPSENCSCGCHKKGISGIFWKILCIFYKLFKINQTCACGVLHY